MSKFHRIVVMTIVSLAIMCMGFCSKTYHSIESDYRTIQPLSKADTFIAECTAYTEGIESCGKLSTHPAYGITASGKRVREGMIAVDTRYIPFGTKVYIEGLGVFVAEDTGGAIKGNRIDIHMSDLNKAIEFGRQNRKVIILE